MLLLEISGSISQDTHKVNTKWYEKEATSPGHFGPIQNIGNYRDRFPKSTRAADEWIRMGLNLARPDIKKFPKPQGQMREFESNPGLWTFTDTSGIRFFMFSDEHRKNAYKGTSIEMHLPEHLWMGETRAEPGRNDGDHVGDKVLDNVISSAIKRLFDKMKELGK